MFCFFNGLTAPVRIGLLIVDVSRPHWISLAISGGTPLDELSARSRRLYQSTRNTHKRQTSMRLARLRTRNRSKRAAVDTDRAATGIGNRNSTERLYGSP